MNRLLRAFDVIVIARIARLFTQPRMKWVHFDLRRRRILARVRISTTTFLYHPERIVFEDNVFVWHFSILDGTGGLTIGTGSQIGAGVGIFTHSSHQAIRLHGAHYTEIPDGQKAEFNVMPVHIGRYVFVGAHSLVMPGTTIGDGAVVAAGSLVTKDVPAFGIVAGSPAKLVGDTRKLDEPALHDPTLRATYDEWASTVTLDEEALESASSQRDKSGDATS